MISARPAFAQRRVRAGLAAMALLLAAAVWVPTLDARARASGAGNCGQFAQSVLDADPGDTLTPMYDEDGGRNSEGATIDKDLVIEGGWIPPSPECPQVNGSYDTPALMIAAGFSYGGPTKPSRLNYTGDPVVTVAPDVKSLKVFDIIFSQGGTGLAGSGGAVRMDGLNGAAVRMENITFLSDQAEPAAQATVDGSGGALYLAVSGGSNVVIDGGAAAAFGADQQGGGLYIIADGGSTVTIRNFTLAGNQAFGGGGGFGALLQGGSTLVLDRVTVRDNQAAVGGGGGRVVIESGTLEVIDSQFTGNTSSAGGGGGLSIERQGSAGTATARLVNTTFSGNSAPGADDLAVSGAVTLLNMPARAHIPLVGGNTAPGASIAGITRTGATYRVAFTTSGYTPAPGSAHVHFFFDTVPPGEAGLPGDGPWAMYDGASPFTGYGVANRPFGARKLCILYANADHSVRLGTGNCVSLP